MAAKLQVKYVERAKLIPYVNNARTHSESQVKQIAASIKEFGFTNPILIDEKNSIIAGHCRLEAAAILEIDTVPTITLTGLSEAQRKAYLIADNKLAMNAGWDFDLLHIELEQLEDITLSGFSEIELKQIIGISEGNSQTGEINTDAFEFDHICPKCKFEFND